MENQDPRFVRVKTWKDDVRRLYAKFSHMYDAWSFITESKATNIALQLANIQDGESMLEVAVGTGIIFKHIVDLNPNGTNEGIDLSPEMLARSKKRLNKRFFNFSLRIGDAYSLSYPDGTFDLIVNNYMFDLLPEEDFTRILLEFRYVLKPKGRMVTANMTPGRNWYSRIWDWLVKNIPGSLGGCLPICLEEDIQQSGFRNVHIEYISQLNFPSLVICAEKT
ncbi:class I SAM-dependent methyltransferase [Chloroflexota bacterium]